MSIRSMTKREGQIPDPKDPATVPMRKLVKVNNKTMVMTFHETPHSITIYVGNRTTYCIDVQIMKDTSNPGHYKPIGLFNRIRYDNQCSLGANFQKGIDTNMILKFIVTYIFRSHNDVKDMRFVDVSTKTCDNGIPVNLGLMTYLWSGKSWYQKNFGAYIEEPLNTIFNQKEQEFQNKKKEISWEIMNSNMTHPLPLPEDEMKALYENSDTWQAFFKPIYDKIGVAKFCNFISGWIDQFLLQYLQFGLANMMYLLPIKDYEIEYTISNYTGGTRRVKRK